MIYTLLQWLCNSYIYEFKIFCPRLKINICSVLLDSSSVPRRQQETFPCRLDDCPSAGRNLPSPMWPSGSTGKVGWAFSVKSPQEHRLTFSKLPWKNFLVKKKIFLSHSVNCEMWPTSHCSGRGWSCQARYSGKFCLPPAGLLALYTGLCIWDFTATQKELSQSEEKYPQGPGEQVTGNEVSGQNSVRCLLTCLVI